MAQQSESPQDMTSVFQAYHEASESYRQEDRNIWHTLYVVLALNGGLLAAFANVFESDYYAFWGRVICVLAVFSTLAGLGIISRMFEYAGRDMNVMIRIEERCPGLPARWWDKSDCGGGTPKRGVLTKILGARGWACALLMILMISWILAAIGPARALGT